MNNTALILIAMQNDHYPNGRMPIEKSVDASNKAQAILQVHRDRRMPVIHIQHISTQPDASYFLPCTKGAEFYSAVAPVKGEAIVKKHYPNSFKDTNLLNHLIKNQINHLIICGMTTHSSVDSTVRAAHDLGFTCTVVHDACAAGALDFNQIHIPAQEVHYAFLAAFQANYANVISTDDFLQKYGARAPLAAMA